MGFGLTLKAPQRVRRSPAAKRILVYFEVKNSTLRGIEHKRNLIHSKMVK